MAATRTDSARGGAAPHVPWLLSSLQSPGQVLGHLGPNWFASIMGTGIVATAAASLPVRVPGLLGFALVVWVATAVLLAVLCGYWAHVKSPISVYEAEARARGRTGGQKPKLGPRQVTLAQQMYDETDNDGKRAHTVAQIAAEFGVTRPTRHQGRNAFGFPNPINQRRRIRWACTRQHRQVSATTTELPGQVR